MQLVASGVLRYAGLMCVRVVVVSLFIAVVNATLGCSDPCLILAERICNCELSANERRACIADRITNQQNATVIDDADRAFCEAKLETCSCDAIDHNDLQACGFANEAAE